MSLSVPLNDIAQPGSVNVAARESIGHRAAVTSVRLSGWGELSGDARSRWCQLRETQPEFSTPFFSLGFIDAVEASRGDVRVAILHDDSNQLVGLMPFHQIGKTAYPAGRFFNDAHNVLMTAETQLNWVWLLKRLGVRSFNFHALTGRVTSKENFLVQDTVQSFSSDLSCGSKQFIQSMESQHVSFRRQEQKTRKMDREIGPVTLEIDCRDEKLLRQAIEWKREQYRRTKILDLFTPDWTRDLMLNLHRSRAAGSNAISSANHFGNVPTRGLLSVLRAGDHVVAMHYGMIEAGLLHYWFPVYDQNFAKFSPGTALFKEIARRADCVGIHTIDMGYGEQPYKRKQTDTITSVRQGCVSGSKPYLTYRRAATKVSETVRQVPMKEQLKWLLRSMKPTAGISKIK